jgi:hypothetical protein
VVQVTPSLQATVSEIKVRYPYPACDLALAIDRVPEVWNRSAARAWRVEPSRDGESVEHLSRNGKMTLRADGRSRRANTVEIELSTFTTDGDGNEIVSPWRAYYAEISPAIGSLVHQLSGSRRLGDDAVEQIGSAGSSHEPRATTIYSDEAIVFVASNDSALILGMAGISGRDDERRR